MVDQREEIKRKIDIVELVSEYLPLKKTGRNYKGLCPFHSEKTPSFVVSPERQIWHCFGACGIGGDVFGFLSKIENIEFGEALRILAKRAGVKLLRYQPTEAEKLKQLYFEINHLASEYYHYVLLNHPGGKKALDYILGRGISKESLEIFKLGFAPAAKDGLTKYLTAKKGYRLVDLDKAGLVISSNLADRFRDRLMFPLKNHRGDVCGFSGRVLGPGSADSPKYINTPETPIYHKSNLLFGLSETQKEIKKADKAVIVEGELDAISSHQAGVKNVVAIKGSALTDPQVQLLARFSKNLILALDADAAGNKAAHRGIEIADLAGLSISVVIVRGGKDPDEVAQKNPKLWQEQVAAAIPVYDYFIEDVLTRFDPKLAEGKRKIGEELVPILTNISNEIVQSHYVGLLAEKLEVEPEVIFGEIRKVKVKEEKSALAVTAKEQNRADLLEEYLLALGFQSGNWARLRKRKVLGLIKIPRYLRILEVLADYSKKYKTLKSEKFARLLPAELLPTFDRLYLIDLADVLKDEEKLLEEFEKAISGLEELARREKLQGLSREIKELEKKARLTTQESKRLEKADEEFTSLSRELR